MKSGLYTLSISTLAIAIEDGRDVAQEIPQGELLTIDERAFCGERLIEVIWAGRTVLMFAEDLRERLQRVEPQLASSAPEKTQSRKVG